MLVLTAGKFGERWRDLAKAFGCQVELVTAAYGQTFLLDEVRGQARWRRARGVHAGDGKLDRSRHDVEGVAQVLRGGDDLLVVDAITGLGTTRFDVHGCGIDVIIGGSQKAVMVPPGVAYLAVSERAWQRMETAKKSALLLRPAQGTESRGQGRIGLHASDLGGRGPGGGARLYPRDGRR